MTWPNFVPPQPNMHLQFTAHSHDAQGELKAYQFYYANLKIRVANQAKSKHIHGCLQSCTNWKQTTHKG
jgi:hypothetical protein